MAAVGMAANTADIRAKEGAVQAENPLFQSMGAEETAMSTATTAAAPAAEATMGMAGMTATTIAEDITAQKTTEQTAIREHNRDPLFQSMGTEEAIIAVANRVEEVATVEMWRNVLLLSYLTEFY